MPKDGLEPWDRGRAYVELERSIWRRQFCETQHQARQATRETARQQLFMSFKRRLEPRSSSMPRTLRPKQLEKPWWQRQGGCVPWASSRSRACSACGLGWTACRDRPVANAGRLAGGGLGLTDEDEAQVSVPEEKVSRLSRGSLGSEVVCELAVSTRNRKLGDRTITPWRPSSARQSSTRSSLETTGSEIYDGFASFPNRWIEKLPPLPGSPVESSVPGEAELLRELPVTQEATHMEFEMFRMQMVAASVRKVQRVWRSKSTKKLSELLDEDEGDASPHGSSLREVLEAAKVDFTGAETMKTPLGAERGDAEASKQASEVVDAEVEGSEMADERLLEGYEEDFHDDDVVTEGQEESKVVSEALEEVEDAFVPATESVEVAVEVDRALALHLNRLSVDSMMQSMTDQPSTMYSGDGNLLDFLEQPSRDTAPISDEEPETVSEPVNVPCVSVRHVDGDESVESPEQTESKLDEEYSAEWSNDSGRDASEEPPKDGDSGDGSFSGDDAPPAVSVPDVDVTDPMLPAQGSTGAMPSITHSGQESVEPSEDKLSEEESSGEASDDSRKSGRDFSEEPPEDGDLDDGSSGDNAPPAVSIRDVDGSDPMSPAQPSTGAMPSMTATNSIMYSGEDNFVELLEQAPENALGDEEYSGEWSNDSQKPVRDASEELPKDGYSGEWSSPGREPLTVSVRDVDGAQPMITPPRRLSLESMGSMPSMTATNSIIFSGEDQFLDLLEEPEPLGEEEYSGEWSEAEELKKDADDAHSGQWSSGEESLLE